jgi:cardiolipin synthase A/B
MRPTIAEEQPRLKRRRRRRRRQLRARGVLGFGARIRRLLWEWWVWAIPAVACGYMTKWGWFWTFASLTFIALLFEPPEHSPTYGLDHTFSIESDEFLSTIAGTTDTPFSLGNRIDILNNGDEFYPRMLEDVVAARESITMEAYIYWEGEIGRRFAAAFAQKAREGLAVKLLLDAVGSTTISDEILDMLTASGCQVAWYHPIHWYTIRRVNNRTHRKSLIIDGRIGYTGGAGIADHWLGCAQDPKHWRDVQIRISGPAVTTLQSGFAQNWLETTNELVTGDEYYPLHEETGTLPVQSILSSPETGASSARLLYYLSIVCARTSIFIANPYFVPDEAAVETLIDAKKRGCDVKLLLSGKYIDNALAYYNSTATYGELLEAGVEIYNYNRTMLHHKIMIVDAMWSTIGTTNFDNRSFALNEENNVSVYDRAFAAELTRDFMADLEHSDRVELEEWRRRGIRVKALEFVASILKEQV